MIRSIISVFLFIVILLGSGCSILRKPQSTDNESFNLEKSLMDHIKEANGKELILIENAELFLELDRKINSRITLYVERDKQIFVSVKYLGFELIRAQITEDSVKYINRLSREYYFDRQANIDLYSIGIPAVGFKEIQDFLFTGFLNAPGKQSNTYLKDYKITGDTLMFSRKLENSGSVNTNYKIPQIKLINLEVLDYSRAIHLEANIERFQDEISLIKGNFQNEDQSGKFELRIQDIKQDHYSKTDFKIGKNYTQISKIF